MNRTYIAGPMTGLPGLNFPAFHAAAAEQRAAGHEVINPAEINGGADELVAHAEMSFSERDAHWRACMRNDITQLMTCNRIVLLNGWWNSRGARLERHIAEHLGMEIVGAGAQP